MLFTRLIFESLRFAWNELLVNPLRTILSLLGVTIGIFAIIGVFTIVDSLESSIKTSLSFLGDKVIYVMKWPWVFNGPYPWWKYMKRPQASYNEFRYLEANLRNRTGITIFADRSRVIAKYKSSSKGDIELYGVSYGYSTVMETPIEKGRYFSLDEVEMGRNVAILGTNISEGLFGTKDPIGNEISIRGLKFIVI